MATLWKLWGELHKQWIHETRFIRCKINFLIDCVGMKCQPYIKHYYACTFSTITLSNWHHQTNKQLFVAHTVRFLPLEIELPSSQTRHCDCSIGMCFTNITGGGEEREQFKKKRKIHHIEQSGRMMAVGFPIFIKVHPLH